jgi:signal transduction histidine kinase
MTLARRTTIASLLVALPAAALIVFAVERVRARDAAAALERVVRANLTDSVREACEGYPGWFLAGPRQGRPTQAERLQPDADVKLPRPSTEELPFEFFAYDDQFSPTSTAGPRFPEDFKRAMRSSPPVRSIQGRYQSKVGTGLQMAQLTGWTPGPCAVLLYRMRPAPNPMRTRALLFAGVFLVCFLIAFATARPTAARISTLAAAVRASARADYSGIPSVRGSDDVSSLAASFNEAAADIRRRIADANDREEALRRHVETTSDDVAAPLAELETRLGQLEQRGNLPPDVTVEVRRAVRDAHQLQSRLQNLAAVARLRTVTDASPRETVNLAAMLVRLVAARQALARATGVAVDLPEPDGTVTVQADAPLLQQAIGNVLDNAILYNRSGGRVQVELRGYEHGGRFSLRISDNGPGVSDEEFAGLTANKRFRGDESRTRRPGGRGLGLALAREVADRFGLQLDLRRPTSGGFEAEFAIRTDRP